MILKDIISTGNNNAITVNEGIGGNESIYTPIGDNFLIDSFVQELDKDGKPIHYHARGNVKIEAVHPYTKGFEGPYVPSKGNSYASDPENATAEHPYFYGRYNKGPRIIRGGLAGGWGGISNGHILKLTYDGSQAKYYNTGFFLAVSFDSSLVVLNKVRLQGYIKIVKGGKVGFGTDSGYRGMPRGFIVDKSITDAAPQGWYKIDTIVGTSRTTNSLSSSNFVMGFDCRQPFEVYVALLRVQPVEIYNAYGLTVPQRTTTI